MIFDLPALLDYIKHMSKEGITEYNGEPKLGGPLNANVEHPSHYTDGKIEVIDFIEDKKLGFHLGNAVKYIARAGKKDPSKYIEDLEKAIWYIRRQIEIDNSLNIK